MEYMLNGSFICNRCRNLCKGPCDRHIQEVIAGNITDENKDLVGRKQRIICLGKWCDNPCSEQDLTQYADVDLTPFLNLIKYLGNKCNELIEEKYANGEERKEITAGDIYLILVAKEQIKNEKPELMIRPDTSLFDAILERYLELKKKI